MVVPLVLLALIASAAAAPSPLKLEKREKDHKVPRMAKIMTMARILGQHHHPAKRETGEKAIAMFHKHGELDAVTIKKVMTMGTEILSPSAAAQGNLEWTAKDQNGYAEGTQTEDGAIQSFEELAQTKSSMIYQGDMIAANATQAGWFRGLRGNTVRAAGGTRVHTLSFGAGTPWTDRKVNYCFADDAPDSIIDAVTTAMQQIEQAVPCIQFHDVQKDPSAAQCMESPAVYITSEDTGC